MTNEQALDQAVMKLIAEIAIGHAARRELAHSRIDELHWGRARADSLIDVIAIGPRSLPSRGPVENESCAHTHQHGLASSGLIRMLERDRAYSKASQAGSSGSVPRDHGRAQPLAHVQIAVDPDADGDAGATDAWHRRKPHEQGYAVRLEEAEAADRLVASIEERRHEPRHHRLSLRGEPRGSRLMEAEPDDESVV